MSPRCFGHQHSLRYILHPAHKSQSYRFGMNLGWANNTFNFWVNSPFKRITDNYWQADSEIMYSSCPFLAHAPFSIWPPVQWKRWRLHLCVFSHKSLCAWTGQFGLALHLQTMETLHDMQQGNCQSEREREIDRTNTIRLTVCFLNVVTYWQNFAIPWVLRGMYSKNHILCRDSKLALAKINQPLWSTYRYSQKSTQTLEKHACGNISKKYIMLLLASFATL